MWVGAGRGGCYPAGEVKSIPPFSALKLNPCLACGFHLIHLLHMTHHCIGGPLALQYCEAKGIPLPAAAVGAADKGAGEAGDGDAAAGSKAKEKPKRGLCPPTNRLLPLPNPHGCKRLHE